MFDFDKGFQVLGGKFDEHGQLTQAQEMIFRPFFFILAERWASNDTKTEILSEFYYVHEL